MEPDRRLDVRGAACPGPSVMVAEELKKMEPGQVLEVIVDSEGIANDLKELAKDGGHQVLKVEETDGDVRVLIRVGGTETDAEGVGTCAEVRSVQTDSVSRRVPASLTRSERTLPS